MTEENNLKNILEGRTLRDILEEMNKKSLEESNAAPKAITQEYAISKKDATTEIKKAFARLSKVNNGVLEDMYVDGALRFKRKVLGYAWASPKLYTSDEFVSKLIELKMFDSEEKARQVLPYFNNFDVSMPDLGSFCDGIRFRYVDSVDNNKLWEIGVYHMD
jgi:hypothetical protein